MSNFGEHFMVSTYGESHYRSVGAIIDSYPPAMELKEDDIQPQMTRSPPGQSALTTPRGEKDRVQIQSDCRTFRGYYVCRFSPIAEPAKLTLLSYSESRDRSVGATIDSYPPAMELKEDNIQPQMTRSPPSQSAVTTPQGEKDRVQIQLDCGGQSCLFSEHFGVIIYSESYYRSMMAVLEEWS